MRPCYNTQTRLLLYEQWTLYPLPKGSCSYMINPRAATSRLITYLIKPPVRPGLYVFKKPSIRY